MSAPNAVMPTRLQRPYGAYLGLLLIAPTKKIIPKVSIYHNKPQVVTCTDQQSLEPKALFRGFETKINIDKIYCQS